MIFPSSLLALDAAGFPGPYRSVAACRPDWQVSISCTSTVPVRMIRQRRVQSPYSLIRHCTHYRPNESCLHTQCLSARCLLVCALTCVLIYLPSCSYACLRTCLCPRVHRCFIYETSSFINFTR